MARRTPKQAAYDLLKANFTMVLSTVSDDCVPQSAVVYYLFEDKNGGPAIYFATGKQSRKNANLAANGKVAMVVGTEYGPRTLQMQGEARKLPPAEVLSDFLKKLSRHGNLKRLYHGDWFPRNPFGKLWTQGFAFYKVRITWMRYMDLSPKADTVSFHEIIS